MVVVEDATGAPSWSEHEAALTNIRNYFGQVATGAQVSAVWAVSAVWGSERRSRDVTPPRFEIDIDTGGTFTDGFLTDGATTIWVKVDTTPTTSRRASSPASTRPRRAWTSPARTSCGARDRAPVDDRGHEHAHQPLGPRVGLLLGEGIGQVTAQLPTTCPSRPTWSRRSPTQARRPTRPPSWRPCARSSRRARESASWPSRAVPGSPDASWPCAR